MSRRVNISPEEAADCLAIRELVEAYAHCADRRDANGQMALFTADTHFVVYMDAKDPKPSMELHTREALAPVFARPEPVRRDHALPWTDHSPDAQWRPRHRGDVLHAPSPYSRRRKTARTANNPDGCATGLTSRAALFI